jgi:hypothetical protein
MEPHSVWEIIFLMLILKIPIVYLCVVVYYAIKAEPRPEEGAPVTVRVGPEEPGPGRRRRTQPRRPRRPHGGPARTYARTAHARVHAERRS